MVAARERGDHVFVDGADVVDLDDVGMADARERLRLAQQPGPHLGRAALERSAHHDELERDTTIELRVVRAVDDAHVAGADALEDDVATDGRTAVQRTGLGRIARVRRVRVRARCPIRARTRP